MRVKIEDTRNKELHNNAAQRLFSKTCGPERVKEKTEVPKTPRGRVAL